MILAAFLSLILSSSQISTSDLPPSPYVHPVALAQHSPGRKDNKNRNNFSFLQSRRARAKVTSVQGSRDPIWSRCSISCLFRTPDAAAPRLRYCCTSMRTLRSVSGNLGLFIARRTLGEVRPGGWLPRHFTYL